jgi:thiamine-phosphate pyrophosphorylase
MTTTAERPALLRGLYAITPGTDDLARLLGLVGAAIDGGTRLVQYRAKELPPSRRLRQGEALLALCRDRGIPLIVNDDLDLAVALGADGVHLGRDDGDPRRARERLPEAILGVSCYDDPSRVVMAAEAGADYAGVGSVFASTTKPGAARAGCGAIAEARRRARIPIAAIGGITAANAGEAVAAGANMIAVISALFDAPDVAAAARALSRPFDTEPDRHVRAQPAAV